MAETEKRNARKVVTGTVVSISGDKSITVKIDYRKRHPKYGKMMTISKKLHAHDLASRGDRRARQVSISDKLPKCVARVGAPLGGTRSEEHQ